MKRVGIIFSVLALTALATLFAWASQWPPGSSKFLKFTNIQSHWDFWPMDQGGVVEDLQLVYHDAHNHPSGYPETQPDPQDQVWAACMNGGFYRSLWGVPTENTWNTWTQYLPGKKGNGVDAIEVNGTEYVLVASSNLGLWYAQGSFTQTWNRPNGDQAYPDAWNQTCTQDVAFYWPEDGFPVTPPPNPQTQYYVISANVLYRWTGISGSEFYQIASGAFDHFYRDLKDADTLYVTRNYVAGPPAVNGALFRLSGSYTASQLDDITPQGYTSVEIIGFNQWKDASDNVTYYLLGKFDGIYKVMVATTLANGNSWSLAYPCPTSWFPSANWIGLQPDFAFGNDIVGKPAGGTTHDLWITTPMQGVMYVRATTADPNSPVITPVQINGPTSSPTLKRWAVRSFVVDSDPNHYQTDEIMRLFFGTHQNGVWYLWFKNATSTSNYGWEPKGVHMYAANPRDVRLIGSEVLAPTFFMGMMKTTTSGGAWSQVLQGGYPQTDPTFNKGMYKGIKLIPSNKYFFGSSPEIIKNGSTALFMGGMYKIESEACSFVPINDPQTVPDADQHYYGISDIVPYSKDANMDSMYVTTGQFGAEDQGSTNPNDPTYNPIPVAERNIISLYIKDNNNNETWQRIWKIDQSTCPNYYTGMGILALEPNAVSSDCLWVGLGNLWTYSSSDYIGRIKCINHGSTLWTTTYTWTAPNPNNNWFSVRDISSIHDPRSPNPPWYPANRELTFWGITTANVKNMTTSFPQKGCLYMRYWWDPTSHGYPETESEYRIEKMYLDDWDGTPMYLPGDIDGVHWKDAPACLAVKSYVRNGSPVVVAVLEGENADAGTSGHENEPVVQTYLYVNTLNYYVSGPSAWLEYWKPGDWTNWGLPIEYNGDNIYPTIYTCDIQIDPNTYDYYIPGDGGVFKFTCGSCGSTIPGEDGGGWHWISFNCMDAADSLKQFIGGLDSLDEVRDQNGRRYLPHNDPLVDSIGVWNWTKFCAMRFSGACTVEAIGPQIPRDSLMILYPDNPTLHYNWIAYLPADTMTCDYAFANTDCVLIVMNDQGQFWRPNRNDNAFDMMPGEGYKVGVSHLNFSCSRWGGQMAEY